MLSIIKHRRVWYVLSGLIVAACVVLLSVFGLHFGIDFTGGSLLEVAYTDARPDTAEVRGALEDLGFAYSVVSAVDERGLIVREPPIIEEEHQVILTSLKSFGALEELRFDSVGPSVGETLRRSSTIALILVLVMIVAYVAWSFRGVSRPVQSWKYGLMTVLSGLHAVLVAIGAAALAGEVSGLSVDAAFVAAILTILGYSVNDTIVVFDRIRENLKRDPHNFEGVVEASVNQTMARSINTNLATLFALVAILFFGGETVRDFVLILIIGILTSTYSSIFIASPLLVTWQKWSAKRQV